MTMTQPKHEPQPKKDTKDESQKATTSEKKKLDIASLDLSMEKVEERISPSETNVFDK
jgi:hypothetical protein